MRFALAALACTLLACSGPGMDDVDPDAAPDTSATDGTIQDAKQDTSKMDGTITDAQSESSDGSIVDSGSDAEILDGAPLFDGGFDIKSLSGLALWLEAATGITKNNQNQISKWADQSGNGNDAIQNTSALQPTWNASVINARPAVQFTRMSKTVLVIADAASVQWGTGDFIIEAVARYTQGANSYGMMYWKANGTGVLLAANDIQNMTTGVSAGVNSSNEVSVNAMYNDNTPRNYAFRRSGSTLDLRVQGAVGATKMQAGSIDVSASGTNVTIGDSVFTGYALDGEIAEIVAIKGSISGQDLTALEAYFKAKYNL